jgi:alpha-tubulin suppressor-like RCC1 family protein
LAPCQIAHGAKFTAVSSGEAFSMALDDKGGAYSWGEVMHSRRNFSYYL